MLMYTFCHAVAYVVHVGEILTLATHPVICTIRSLTRMMILFYYQTLSPNEIILNVVKTITCSFPLITKLICQ